MEIKWAILGPGAIANQFAQALKDMGQNAYAVGSRSIERAKEFANRYGIKKAYGNYEELLQDSNIDAVYISTPHSNHYEYIVKSLNSNKHVMCEKSITVNNLQLKEAAQIADKRGLILTEAMTIYHMPLYKKLSDMIADGKIGNLKMIQVSFGSCKENDASNRFFNMDLAGGAILDIGTYAISFARYFMSSSPAEIVTTVKKFETGVDEQSGIVLKNNLDEMAVISLTMRAKMPKRGIVAGDKGFIVVDDFPRAQKATITYTDGKFEIVENGNTEKAMMYEIEDMNRAIELKKENTLKLSMDVMNIISDIRQKWEIKYPFES